MCLCHMQISVQNTKECIANTSHSAFSRKPNNRNSKLETIQQIHMIHVFVKLTKEVQSSYFEEKKMTPSKHHFFITYAFAKTLCPSSVHKSKLTRTISSKVFIMFINGLFIFDKQCPSDFLKVMMPCSFFEFVLYFRTFFFLTFPYIFVSHCPKFWRGAVHFPLSLLLSANQYDQFSQRFCPLITRSSISEQGLSYRTTFKSHVGPNIQVG